MGEFDFALLLDLAVVPFLVFGMMAMNKITKLEEDNREIKALLEKLQSAQSAEHSGVSKKIDNFQNAVSEKVETIMRDHNAHEVGQARLETKLDLLVRKHG